MQWSVREAFPEDAERLALIGSATFLETFAGALDGDGIVAHCRREHSALAYGHYLRGDGSAWLAEAATGRAPIGFALLAPADLPGSDPGQGDIELKRIYTLSRFHGGGLGAELMRRAVARAIEKRARRLLLGVYAGNERALAFYLKNGFERVGERRFRVGGCEYDDYVLARPLD